ncbi:hypothetical protein J1N35_044123 [Gossypium stocksii]|uniref:Uncharacterized protein n=1 Tax=Gossypium stocksii TaxID=47602 RepID=A0A9D3U8S5_9ROSI|nr:hypothetical protein J1N35_044123 [Gossypium stocksii]
MEARSLRSQTSNDFMRRDPYCDFYSSRNSSRYKANHEFEAFQGDKREGASISSTAPKFSSTEVSKDSFDKFQLQYLPDKRRSRLIKKGKIENEINPQVLKGDNLKWYPSKKGGRANNLLSLRTICDSQVFGSDFVRFMNKGVRDLERFFESKWPDLRTNHFQEEGYDAIPAASCHDTIRRHRNWPKHEGVKCKMKL